MQGGEGLRPSSQGKRLAFDGASRTVTDGPFPATAELEVGFWLWEGIGRGPEHYPMPGPSVEIAPVKRCPDF